MLSSKRNKQKGSGSRKRERQGRREFLLQAMDTWKL